MTTRPKVITAPVKEPVSLDEAKEACRLELDETDSDFDLELLIQATREYVEDKLAATIHETTLESTWDCWPACNYIALPRATPLVSVTSFKYTDEDGVETTWASSNYIVDTDSVPGRVYLTSGGTWPSTTLYPANGIRIRYVAGIATSSPVTECRASIKLICRLLIGGWYDNRSSFVLPERNGIEAVAIRYGVDEVLEEQRNSGSYVF